jgi:YHYH protein
MRATPRTLSVLCLPLLLAAACGGGSAGEPAAATDGPATDGPGAASSGTGPGQGSASTSAGAAGVPAAWSQVIDPAAIPLGDDKISTEPVIGSLYSCKTRFGGRGAPHGGPWINEANKTWDSTTKVHVQGSRTWPQATYREATEGETRVITSADLPTRQVTGTFPIAETDPAHRYDRNPNAIAAQTVELRLPQQPTAAAIPSCVDLGPAGVLKNGVYFYNAIDAAGGDAAAHETQDSCDGHPDGTESYHYHNIPGCLVSAASKEGSTLIGYALDGYGIYIERDADGNLPSNADLDACHGRTSTVRWNGKTEKIYHYSATLEFPYTIGCYHGTPINPPRR